MANTAAPKPRQSTTRTALAGLIGNVLEWFDFAAYGFFVNEIGAAFFPQSSPTAQQLYAFTGYAFGFVGRLIGSMALGPIGDRIGRRALLTLSIALIGGATLSLGLLPGYEQLGVAAPVLLVLLRTIQGFSVGAEFTGSMVYTTEGAAQPSRGLVSSSTAAGTTLGIMLGNAVALLIRNTLTQQEQASWGWRIPFIVSVVFLVAGVALRRGLAETAEGKQAAAARPRIVESVIADWLPMLRTFGIVAMTNVAYYLTFTWAAPHRTTKGGSSAFWAANLLSLAVVLVAKPFGGWLSDRIGRRRLMMILTAVGAAATFVALPVLLEGSPWEFWYAQILMGVPLGMALGLQGAMISEIFPLRTRVTSMSIAYSATLLLAGALTPDVSTWLIDVLHRPSAPAYYVLVYGVLGLAIMWPMKETNARRLDTNDAEAAVPTQAAR